MSFLLQVVLVLLLCPRSGGALRDDAVWRLSVCRVRREQRWLGRSKLAEVAHVTRDLDTTFKVKRSKSPGRFGWLYWHWQANMVSNGSWCMYDVYLQAWDGAYCSGLPLCFGVGGLVSSGFVLVLRIWSCLHQYSWASKLVVGVQAPLLSWVLPIGGTPATVNIPIFGRYKQVF